MEFKLALCVLSLLIGCKTHKILVLSRDLSRDPLSLPELASVLSEEDELHYLTLSSFSNRPSLSSFSNRKVEYRHGLSECRTENFSSRTDVVNHDQPWCNCKDKWHMKKAFSDDFNSLTRLELEEHDDPLSDTLSAVVTTLKTELFDLIIIDQGSVPLIAGILHRQTVPVILYMQDKLIKLPSEHLIESPAKLPMPTALPPKNFTERFNAIKQLIKYLISVYKKEGASRAQALVHVFLRKGRLGTLQYTSTSQSYIEQYDIDVWCCGFTIVAVIAGTAVYLAAIITLHILEKSRARARIM